MSKARIKYNEQEDVLHLVISDEPELRSVGLSPALMLTSFSRTHLPMMNPLMFLDASGLLC